jgi:hypothetical protein
VVSVALEEALLRSVVKAHIHRPPASEILRRQLRVAAAVEFGGYRWHMSLSERFGGVETPNGDDEARWVVATQGGPG